MTVKLNKYSPAKHQTSLTYHTDYIITLKNNQYHHINAENVSQNSINAHILYVRYVSKQTCNTSDNTTRADSHDGTEIYQTLLNNARPQKNNKLKNNVPPKTLVT